MQLFQSSDLVGVLSRNKSTAANINHGPSGAVHSICPISVSDELYIPGRLVDPRPGFYFVDE
jgi:hypothetical protein